MGVLNLDVERHLIEHEIIALGIWRKNGLDIYYLDGKVGVGTTTPGEKLEIQGNLFLNTDSNKAIFGAGKDMDIYYDGVDGYIRTDVIVASDLNIDCGTNKTIELQETVWDDQQVDIGRVRLGASAPTWTAYKGSEVLAFDKAQDNKIFFTAQLSHKYKESSNIEFHIHEVFPDSNAGNVRWIFTYSWASIGSDFPAESTTTIDIASPEDADNHQLDEIDESIDGTGKTISSVLLCSLTREGTHDNDTYDNSVYLVALDFHIEMNTVGSRTESAK